MKAIAVHGLGGGFTYGVREGGADLVHMIETPFAEKIRRLNLPDVPEYQLGTLRGPAIHMPVDLVFGCPPCAGFSVAGSGMAQHDNPDHPINDGIRDWFHWVHSLRPTIAVLESVPRTFFSPAGRDLWEPLAAKHLEDYGITLVTYDNQQLGVPQRRVRTLFWAMMGGCPDVLMEWRDNRQCTTSWALTDLGEPTVGWEVDEAGWGHNVRPVSDSAPDWVMRYVPWGGNARKQAEDWHIWEELQKRGRQRPSFLWRRLHPHRPAPVLLADACERVGHYQGDSEGAGERLRYLSGREVARLMGYPDSFRLAGHLRRDVGPALCQAVSPKVGYWVGVEASRLLEAGNPYLQGPDTVVYRDLTQLLPSQ